VGYWVLFDGGGGTTLRKLKAGGNECCWLLLLDLVKHFWRGVCQASGEAVLLLDTRDAHGVFCRGVVGGFCGRSCALGVGRVGRLRSRSNSTLIHNRTAIEAGAAALQCL
jgi:hypothetical protein